MGTSQNCCCQFPCPCGEPLPPHTSAEDPSTLAGRSGSVSCGVTAPFPWEIQPVHSEGDQPWNFFGRNDAKAETPVLWPLHAKSWLIRKDSDAGRDWGQEEKGTTEDEMAGWYHWLDGCESGWTPGVGDGQGGLACCDSWGRKESDTTEWLNWTECAQDFVCTLQEWGPHPLSPLRVLQSNLTGLQSPIPWEFLVPFWTPRLRNLMGA